MGSEREKLRKKATLINPSVNIMIVGPPKSGKTHAVNIMLGSLSETQIYSPTKTMGYGTFKREINGIRYTVRLRDTPGNRLVSSFESSYYKSHDIVIIMYKNTTDIDEISCLVNIINDVYKYGGKVKPGLEIVFVVNDTHSIESHTKETKSVSKSRSKIESNDFLIHNVDKKNTNLLHRQLALENKIKYGCVMTDDTYVIDVSAYGHVEYLFEAILKKFTERQQELYSSTV